MLDKDDVFKKWQPILDNIGVTGSKADWMSEYMNNTLSVDLGLTSSNENFPLLPIAVQVAAQTIGKDLVSVAPLGGGNSGEELNKIRKEILAENRDRKIDSVIEGEEYKEMKVEDHPDYREGSGPSGHLFYMDFKYDNSTKKNKKRKI